MDELSETNSRPMVGSMKTVSRETTMQGPPAAYPRDPRGVTFRATPSGTLARPVPVPLGAGTITRPSTSIIGTTRPVPVTGLQVPSTNGGLTVQRPSVLLPGTSPVATTGTIGGGRPQLDRPVTSQSTYPQPTYPQLTYPQRITPQTLPQMSQQSVPGMSSSRATATSTTTNGTCATSTNTGLIGLFDRTIGAAVKSLLGMTEASCTTLANRSVR